MCEAVKVTVPELESSVLCHCGNCKTQSSSVGSLVALLDEKDLEVSGELTRYNDEKTTSGKQTWSFALSGLLNLLLDRQTDGSVFLWQVRNVSSP
jgi:hypothetical protein